MIISQPSRGLRRSLSNKLNRKPEVSLGSYYQDGTKYPTVPIETFELDIPAEPGERLTIVAESMSSEAVDGAALFELQALTSTGARVAIPQWGYRSNRIQEYQYIAPAEPGHVAMTVLSVPIPPGASSLKLVGRKWKKDVATSVIGAPVVNSTRATSWKFETETGAKLEYPAWRYHDVLEISPGTKTIRLSVNHIARNERSAGPLAIKFLDSDSNELMPIGELAQHPIHGSISVLNGAPDAFTTTHIELSIPDSARYVSFTGLDWANKTPHIVGGIRLEAIEDKQLSIEQFIASIPLSEQLYVVDTTAPPVGHSTLGLRPNNLSYAAIAQGHWVVFLPFSSLQEFPAHPEDNLYQVPRSNVDRLWTALRTYRENTHDTYVCSSFPSFEAVTVAHDLRRLGWTIVYEVRDDMEEFNRVGYSRWYRPVLEQRMLALADCVVSVSRALDEKMTVMQPQLGRHTVIPNAVRQSVIDDDASLRTISAARARENSHVVGYVGHLTDSWFDWPLLISAAQSLPDITFEIVGHGMPANLQLPSNVYFLGPKSHNELLEIVARWGAGIIPFKDIPLTHSVDPNKIYEYFAWGLRCVTVQMGSVDTYPWTKVYSGHDSFVESLQWALHTPVTNKDLDQLDEFVTHMSWATRMEEMLVFIEGVRE